MESKVEYHARQAKRHIDTMLRLEVSGEMKKELNLITRYPLIEAALLLTQIQMHEAMFKPAEGAED